MDGRRVSPAVSGKQAASTLDPAVASAPLNVSSTCVHVRVRVCMCAGTCGCVCAGECASVRVPRVSHLYVCGSCIFCFEQVCECCIAVLVGAHPSEVLAFS